MPVEIKTHNRSLNICGACEGFQLEAESAEKDASGAPKARRFSMIAYTGDAMRLDAWMFPVVVELSGLKIPSQSRPILRQHDPERIVGHTDSIEVMATKLKAAGVISGISEAANEIVATAKNGFPWQASIGAQPDRIELVDRGETVKVNGRNFTGPLYVVRAATLGEISFVPIGADGATSATVVASQSKGVFSMQFEQWLVAQGFDPATMSDGQKRTLQGAFKASEENKGVETHGEEIKQRRKIEAAEARRVAGIRRICAKVVKPVEVEIETDGRKEKVSLESQAIEAGWTVEKTELEMLRASRASVCVHATGGDKPRPTSQVLECALAQSVKLPNIEKAYKPEILEEAHAEFRRLGLQQLLLIAAAENGYTIRPGARITTGNLREVMAHAFGHVNASGFSSVSLPGILSNVANKEILTGYMEEDQSWREISQVKSVSDFKQVTSYRMFDNLTYEEIGPSGEIKGGSVGEESYTRQAKTYAKMLSLTRQDIINDDLGTFSDLAPRLGRGASRKFSDVFWTEFLSDAGTFWTAARTNYIIGSTTTLLTDGVGLGLAVKAFRQMTSPTADGSKRVNGRPEILLVPPELEKTADELYANSNLGNVANGSANIYAKKYRPVVQVRLSDSSFTGYSTTAWYLFNPPTLMAPMCVSFLDGQETPTIESAEADFNVLGIQFRGYHDWGCDQAEYLAGIKSKGAA